MRKLHIMTKSFAEYSKNIAQTLAFIAAALFFGYKAALGWNWLTVSIDLTTERVSDPSDDECDIIAITLNLENGSNGAFKIHDALVLVRYDSTTKLVRFSGMMRLNYKDGKLVPGQANPDDPYVGLGPSEELVFSAHVSVPYEAVCSIDIAVLCKRPYQKVAEALSSTVSLPFRSNKQPITPD